MAKTTNTAVVVSAKPTIAQIAAMTKAERAAYIAMRTGAQTDDVELDLSAARELRELNPRGGVPTIVIDGQTMVGFDADEAERRLIAAARRRLAAE